MPKRRMTLRMRFLFIRRFGELERYLSDQLQQLGVIAFQFDDFRESRLSLGLLGDPCIYGIFRNTVICCSLDDRYAVIFDAIDNLLLHLQSDAMFFHMLVY